MLARFVGDKRYELKDHLGNVRVVITDEKESDVDGGVVLGLLANVDAYNDYYAFGMTMPGRTLTSSLGYRYGFNGKEKDSEWGGGAMYDYGFRIYDPRIAKFLSVDPLTEDYPWYTPYQFAGNKPIACVDLDGLEEYLIINKQSSNGQWKTVQGRVGGNRWAVKDFNVLRAQLYSRIVSNATHMKHFIKGRLSYSENYFAPDQGTLTINIYPNGTRIFKYDPTKVFNEGSDNSALRDMIERLDEWLVGTKGTPDTKDDPNSSGYSDEETGLGEMLGSGYEDNSVPTGKSEIKPGNNKNTTNTNNTNVTPNSGQNTKPETDTVWGPTKTHRGGEEFSQTYKIVDKKTGKTEKTGETPKSKSLPKHK